MKKTLIFILLILLALGASAQRRRKEKTPPPPTPEELAEMARKEKYDRRLQAIERVTFIDSVILKKRQLLDVISLGAENGSLHHCKNYIDVNNIAVKSEYVSSSSNIDTLDCTLFRSQLGDKIVFAYPTDTCATLQMFASEKLGDRWTEPLALEGLSDSASVNYPYMMSDGVTLYFASQDKEGLGGYDIYMTRWDDDSKTFYKPENIGMPFNSEANDYLYIIDEFNQLGWFATDRGLNSDSVCLYTFIPTDSRRIYNAQELGYDTLVNLANINCIRDTWVDRIEVKKAIDRLEEIKKTSKRAEANAFSFIINDNILYTDVSQFIHKGSLPLVEKWIEKTKRLNYVVEHLEGLRLKFAKSSNKDKTELTPKITKLEAEYENLLDEINIVEKEIRSFEQR